MKKLRSRCAPRAPRLIALALIVMFVAVVPSAFAGLDEGTFEFSQPGSSSPVAWVWVSDDTSDGDGTEYVAYTDDFVHGGAANPTVVTTTTFRTGVSQASLQAFVNWIVATNANVSSAADLTIHKRVVTTVSLP